MEINKENMFEKFFDGFQAKFIESFKALGEEKILVRILENQKASKEEYRTYFNCAWEFLQTTEIAAQQAKVEELQTQLSLQRQRVKAFEEELTSSRNYGDELQKQVQFLEQELGAWKGKSIAAMINGMCKQCGKEPWQAIVSDKDGYALLHCFGCGANKYELVGEQALNGDQYDEHRKKAEEAISKGASLTNHRIEL